MKPFPYLALLAPLLISGAVSAEERTGTLAQTREAFKVLDANKDARLGAEERAGLDPQLTRGVDFDGDGFWSKDEFLLFHRQRLLAAKVKPAADLEAEATRIQAARKAKATERNTRRDPPKPVGKESKGLPPRPAPREPKKTRPPSTGSGVV